MRAVEEELPWAKVIGDRFHVAKAYRECADEARKRELQALKKSMSAEEYAEVKGVMWPFRKKPEELEPYEKPLLERVFTQSPALAQAYKLREELTAIFEREYAKAVQSGQFARGVSGASKRAALLRQLSHDPRALDR